MATLTSQSIKDTYKDMLHLYDGLSATDQGFESSLKTLYDGEGEAGPVKMSSTTLNIPSGKTLSVDGSLSGAVFTDVGLPSQSGNNGKYLTTNGSVSSWGALDALPSQSGNAGKFLITDGTDATWETIDTEITAIGTLSGATPLVFEGATANDYETTFAITDPTADRTITFPNATGTVTLEPASGSYLVHDTAGHVNIETDYQSGKQLQYNGTEVSKVGHTHSGYAASGANADITSMTGLALTPFVIEGTADAHETSVIFTDPTADRSITFPNATGTVITTGNLTNVNGTIGANVISTGKFNAPDFQLWDGGLNYYSGMSYNAANLVQIGKTENGGSDHCDILVDTGTTLVIKGILKQSTVADPSSPPAVQTGAMYSDGDHLYFGSDIS